MAWWHDYQTLEANDVAIWNKLGEIKKLIVDLTREVDIEMAIIDDLTSEVANNTVVSQSAAQLVANLADQIQTLINSGANPAQLQALVDTLRNNDVSLAAAVTAGTPVATTQPPATPVPPEVLPT